LFVCCCFNEIDILICSPLQLATEVIDINNGCSCCSLASDLKNKIYLLHQEMIMYVQIIGFINLISRECKVQYLVVETSGVSNPGNIIQMLDENFGIIIHQS
jgi:G3E family GTPase